MTRSRRRALAMSWSVAIGVLHAGVGIAGAAPAGADPRTPNSESGADTTQAIRDSASRVGVDNRRHASAYASWQRRIGMPADPAGGVQAGRSGVSVPDHWECHWPDWRPVNWPGVSPVNGIGVGGGGGGLILVASTALAPRDIPAPPTTLGPATDRILTGLTGGEPLPATNPVTAPLGGPFPPGPPVPPPPVPNATAPAGPPAAPPAPVAPASATEPAEAPKAVADQPNPLRAGYPDYLKAATPAEVAALALTGAAGLAALAGAGGFVGYRQARAGFALRAAGTARFLS